MRALELLDDTSGSRPALDGFDKRDRALIKQLVNGTLRWQGLIDYRLNVMLEKGIESLPDKVASILRQAVFQLDFLDRVPDFAAVDEAVKLAGVVNRGNFRGLVNGVLRNYLRRRNSIGLPDEKGDATTFLAVKYSHPRWLVENYVERFGSDEAAKLLTANNEIAPLTIRSIPAGGVDGLQGFLDAKGYRSEKCRFAQGALSMEGNPDPEEIPGFDEGVWYVQDEAQIAVAGLAAAGLKENGVILDLCAAPGGKAGVLAEKASESAFIVAADSDFGRLNKMRENFIRLNFANLSTVCAQADHPPFKRADMVLCDVPCSGTGVFRRKPGLRWRITPEAVTLLSKLQKKIILAAADMLEPGGVLLYSTCTLEPEENRGVVKYLLERRKCFSLENAADFVSGEIVADDGFLEMLPHKHGTDGAFAARLKKI